MKYNLMYRDIAVLEFEDRLSDLRVLNDQFLPFGMRTGRLDFSLYTWLVDRATPLLRENAVFLYMVLGKSRTPEILQNTMLEYGGISINDV